MPAEILGRLIRACSAQAARTRACNEAPSMSIATRMKYSEEVAIAGMSPKISLRLYPDLDRAIRAWMQRQPGGKLSRPEAIRQLLVEALARK